MSRDERPTEKAERDRLDALIHLLGDEDPKIRRVAWRELEGGGESVRGRIERAAEAAEDRRVRRKARQFRLEMRRREVLAEWLEFCKREPRDLEEGVLLIVRSEYPEEDVEALRSVLDRGARGLEKRVSMARNSEVAIQCLVEFVHGELGLRGNGQNYYDVENSYLNRVLERKLGIPITIGCVYLLLARRLSIPLEGVGMPSHFLLKYPRQHSASRGRGRSGECFLDPFNEGRRLSARDCAQMLEKEGLVFEEKYLRAASDGQILHRMLGNLLRIYHLQKDERRERRVNAMGDTLCGLMYLDG